jgi:streptogramin lyase
MGRFLAPGVQEVLNGVIALRALLTGLIALLLLPQAATAIDEFPVGSNPGGITTGSDGALWFVEEGTSRIGRITTAGAVSYPSQVTTAADPATVSPLDQIIAGPDGALWFTQPRDNQIGRITTAGGTPTEFSLDSIVSGAQPEGITVGPDGALWFTAAGIGKIGRIPTNPPASPPHGITLYPSVGVAGTGITDLSAGPDGALWFTESTGNAIGRITTGGTITNHFPVPTAGSEPSGITQGPGGGLWFTQSAQNQVAQITTGGIITEYPGAGGAPSSIAAGGDGALWFTESDLGANAIGRITTGGTVTNHFPVPTPGSEPSDITAGPDGALWFTEFLGNKVGRIDTATAFVPPPPPPPVRPLTTPRRKKACKVPRLRGLSVRKAKKRLKRAKCRYRVRGRGTVVSTRPKAGRRTTKRVLVKARAKAGRPGNP